MIETNSKYIQPKDEDVSMVLIMECLSSFSRLRLK